MRALKLAGLVSSFNVPNINEAIFGLSSAGIQSVANALGLEKSELKWNEPKAKPQDYYFMQHFIAINDFRLALRSACENGAIKLLGFIPDYYGEQTDKGGVVKYVRDMICDINNRQESISHTPDGVFALSKEGKSALFFLEIDRGTETVSVADKGVLKCLRFYANYLIDGGYQRYAKDFNVPEFKGFRSLLITTSDARLANIRQAVGSLQVPEKAKRFSWITTQAKLNASTMFTPIWYSVDPKDGNKYQIG